MEIKAEDKELRAERARVKALLGSTKEQWKTVGGQIKEIRDKFGPKTALGKRRTGFGEAPEHDEAAIEEAMVVREPVTVVVSEKGWIRALRGHVTDFSNVAFKAGDSLQFAFPTETTAKALLFASNGRFYTIDVSKLPGGRGFGEPIRLYADMEQEAVVIAAMAFKGGRKFLVASKAGNGFIVAEDESVANTRKGKQVLNLKSDEARALAIVEGDLIASIGENRKMLIFPIADIPEMSRGRGVRLQRFREKGLADVTTFAGDAGLTWIDSAGRSFTLSLKELKDWRGKRADAGRLAPKGFPKSNRFKPTVVSNGGSRADEPASQN
jgi:topoisomerase-4 subunit A